MTLWLALACSDSDKATTDTAEDTAAGAYIDADTLDISNLALSELEVEAAVTEVLVMAIEMNPVLLWSAYEDVLAAGDSSCPTYNFNAEYSYGSDHSWSDSCTTSGGTTFSGSSIGISFGPHESGLLTYQYRMSLSSSFTVTRPDGSMFLMSGEASASRTSSTSTESSYASLTGEFHGDGPDEVGTWLGQDLLLELTLLAEDGFNTRKVIMEGALVGLTGDVTASSYEELYFQAGNEVVCPTEPYGLISVRDSHGEWYDVQFHGESPEGQSDATLCDGCGDILYRGVSIGTACPDLDAYLNWKDSPWD